MGICSPIKKTPSQRQLKDTTLSINQTSEKNINSNIQSLTKKESPIKIYNRLSEKTKFDDVNKFIKIKDIFLGRGVSGIVREGIDSKGENFAIKSIWKNDVSKNIYFKREVNITLELIHENIIKCYEIYEDNNSLHFILELCQGGDLFDHIIHSPNQKLSEEESIDILHQILKSLIYLHEELKIIHRDIKPENFLIKNENGKNIIKLTDFGFSDYIPKDNNGRFTEQIGTPQYAAPEIYEGKNYNTKVDLWSVGVVLYNMINGTQPFSGNKNKSDTIMDEVLHKKINFNGFKNPQLKNLAMHLLERDPDKRVNAIQAFSELQLIKESDESCQTIPSNFNPDIKKVMFILNNDVATLKDLRTFYITYIESENLTKLYMNFHKNKNFKTHEDDHKLKEGRIYVDAQFLINETLKHEKYVNDDFKNEIEKFIKEKGEEKLKRQLIDVTKFFHVSIEAKKFIQKQRIYNEFKNLDKDNKGYLTKDEIFKLVTDKTKLNDFPHIHEDEKIDFGKFYNYYIIYNKIKVPTLGIEMKRVISLTDN